MQDAILTILSQYNISTNILDVIESPLATAYEVDLGNRVLASGRTGARQRIAAYKRLEHDLSISLGETVSVQLHDNSLYITVIKTNRDPILLTDILEKPEKSTKFLLGQSLIGQNIHVDITSLPHLLVAGSTGSGKSIFLNGLIYQLSRFNHPDKLQFVLCDPKKVELSIWGDLPHVIQEPFTNLGDMLKASAWLTKELDIRYEAMRKAKVRTKLPDMAYIVAIVDELADIRLSYYGSDFENNMNRIAALGRAAGIHLVLATQRPSADIITGVLKSNITASTATF